LVWIAGICFSLGFALCVILIDLTAKNHLQNTPCVDCGLVYVAFGLVATVGNALIVTIIALLAGAFYRKPKS